MVVGYCFLFLDKFKDLPNLPFWSRVAALVDIISFCRSFAHFHVKANSVMAGDISWKLKVGRAEEAVIKRICCFQWDFFLDYTLCWFSYCIQSIKDFMTFTLSLVKLAAAV
jgi:hypothetical protein